MKLEDKIYFLGDVLDEFEKRGGDREAAEAFYWTLLDELLEDISETDNVTYRIPNFGTLYYTLSSLHNSINMLQRVVDKGSYKNQEDKDKIEKKLSIFKSKLERMSTLIEKAKKEKVNKIWFFRTRFNPKLMKNG
jgi:hypothetical protein